MTMHYVDTPVDISNTDEEDGATTAAPDTVYYETSEGNHDLYYASE